MRWELTSVIWATNHTECPYGIIRQQWEHERLEIEHIKVSQAQQGKRLLVYAHTMQPEMPQNIAIELLDPGYEIKMKPTSGGHGGGVMG